MASLALAALLSLLAVLAVSRVHASPDSAYVFFPAACSSSGRQCCPDYMGEQCGGPTRGNCTNALAAGLCDDPYGTFVWFTQLFDDVCVCAGNRAGAACDECKDGWTGDDCEEAEPLRVRRPFPTLSEAEREQLRYGLQLLKDTEHPYWAGVDDGNENVNIYNWLVAQHHYAMWPELPDAVSSLYPDGVEFAHGSALLSWHRRYMLSIESHMRRLLGDSNFTIPYWDPTSASYQEALDFVGGDGDRSVSPGSYACWTESFYRKGCNCSVTNGPFAAWRTVTQYGRDTDVPLQRAFGCDQGITWPYGSKGLPTPHMAYMYAHELYWQVAHLRMTVIHRNSHGHVGQTMFYGKSPSDPIFFLLHSWIDLMQERWIRNAIVNQVFSIDNIIPLPGTNVSAVGQTREECIAPMFPLTKNREYWKPLVNFGVTYAEFADADPAVTTPRYIPDEALPAHADWGVDLSEPGLGSDSGLTLAEDHNNMGFMMVHKAGGGGGSHSSSHHDATMMSTKQQRVAEQRRRHREAATSLAAARRERRHLRRHRALEEERALQQLQLEQQAEVEVAAEVAASATPHSSSSSKTRRQHVARG